VSTPRRRWLADAGLSLVAAILAAWIVLPAAGAGAGDPAVQLSQQRAPAWLLPFDDSYIFVRFAQQLNRGRPLQWNDGEFSTGASSFLFPALLLPGQWFASALPGWSRWSRAVGLWSLWLLALCCLRLLRTVGLPGHWPWAGALCVLWSGPITLSALAGMESALAAAWVVLAASLWMEGRRGRRLSALGSCLLLAFAPLLRPEFALLSGLAAVAVVVRRGPALPLWTAPAVLLPGLLLAVLDLVLTGQAGPAGATAKSILAAPYPDLVGQLREYLAVLRKYVLPVYWGSVPRVLPPPVGLCAVVVGVAALVGAGARRGPPALREVAPLAVAWWTLLAVAPLSSMVFWQYMRHHQVGLVCAWLLATVLAAILADRAAAAAPVLRRPMRLLPLALALGPLSALPAWSDAHDVSAAALHRAHGPAAAELMARGGHEVLLLNDAGLVAIAHDGAAVDLIGLGTNEMVRPFRHGPGAVVEQLARREVLPELAAVNLHMLSMPELLGAPLRELPLPLRRPPAEAMVLAPLRTELLLATVRSQPGVDLAFLADEERADLRWGTQPVQNLAAVGMTLLDEGGRPSAQGCRPIRDRLGLGVAPGALGLQLAMFEARSGRVVVRRGDAVGPDTGAPPLAELEVPQGELAWSQLQVVVPRSATHVWVETAEGGPACLESVTVVRD
jgi:hypothetical protein